LVPAAEAVLMPVMAVVPSALPVLEALMALLTRVSNGPEPGVGFLPKAPWVMPWEANWITCVIGLGGGGGGGTGTEPGPKEIKSEIFCCNLRESLRPALLETAAATKAATKRVETRSLAKVFILVGNLENDD
jgi:hypothetical protein